MGWAQRQRKAVENQSWVEFERIVVLFVCLFFFLPLLMLLYNSFLCSAHHLFLLTLSFFTFTINDALKKASRVYKAGPSRFLSFCVQLCFALNVIIFIIMFRCGCTCWVYQELGFELNKGSKKSHQSVEYGYALCTMNVERKQL